MITVTRLPGSVFALNSDLIERVDATPDTVITLVDGKKYVVRESLEDVVAAICAYRGAIIAEGTQMSVADQTEPGADPAEPAEPAEPRRLTAVPLHTQPAAGDLKHDET